MRLRFLVAMIFTCAVSFAQLSGVKTIPGDYATFALAVSDLNTQGVGPGGVTFNIAAGYTESNVAALLTIATNPPNATRPIIFQKSGAGANPLFTASVGVSTTVDGIIILNGADNITFDGIDLQENPANVTSTTQMEWGYALVKASATNGCQYVTIKNSTVTLNKTNTATVGIYSGNHLATSTTALTVASFLGTNSFNKFYNNTVQNSFHGIDLTGYASGAPYDLYDQNNQIGVDGVSPNPNRVLDFGGGATGTANAITCASQNNLKIFNTTIDNSTGATTTTTLNGILTSSSTNANIDIYNITVTLIANGTTSSVTGINNGAGGTGAGNTVNIYGCTITGSTYSTATTGTWRGIVSSSSASYTNIFQNTVSNNTQAGIGDWSAIFYNGSSATLCLNVNINNNTISGNTKTGTAGAFYCINASSSTNTTNCFGNQMFNNSASASSAIFVGYYNFAFGIKEYVYNNQFYSNTAGTGQILGFDVRSGSGPTDKQVYANTVRDILGGGQVGGIQIDYGTNVNVYRNNIYNLSSTATTGTSGTPNTFGINVGTNVNSYVNLFNNFISDLKAPNLSSTTAIYGIWMQGSTGSTFGVYHNSIFMNASSSGTNFGTAGLALTSASFSNDLRNNIVVNNSIPAGTGYSVALVRNTASLTNYALTSGYNCLYAGTPSATNLIYSDGTNTDQTLEAFKTRVGPREQSSFSEIPPFVNSSVAPYDLHLQSGIATQSEGGGKAIASVIQDYDGTARNLTTPDVGADEFSGITTDAASPDIQYALLTNSGVAASRLLPAFATITDPSGINSVVGTRPRLYYKKSIHANTFIDNTSATDCWKYVEASNATSPFAFTIDYSILFGGSVSAGDVIQYFVVAQDLNGTSRIGLNNGGFTVQPTGVALAAANFPLNNTINQYAIVAAAYSGTIPVGPTETITSLTNAGGMFALFNAGVLNGNVTISITGDLTAETGTTALNQWAETDGSGYTVSIVPSAAAMRTISGSNATLSLIRLDGADRVRIDGRFGGAGNFITLRNTSNSAPTVGFINDAQNNTLRNCIIESGNTATSTTAGGAVLLGTTNGTSGNDNNTITENEIRDRSDVAGTPAIAINCTGSTTAPAQFNSGVVISNNNIHDWFLLNNANQFGIQVAAGNTNFTITGNSFYQTATRTNTVAGAVTRAINITNATAATTSGGYDISGNFIGGSAPGATGSDWTLTAAVSQTFGGISVTTGLIPTSIQNNIVRKINFTTNAPSAATTMFFGISVTQGIFNIGTLTGNTIGAATGTGSISVTINAGGAVNSFLAGILASPTNGYANISNNTIGGWTIAGATVSGGIVPQYIQYQGTPAQNFSIANNLVGSTTTANSIQNTVVTAPCIAFGIRLISSTGAAPTISNNTIQNVTDLSTAASSADYGILLISSTGQTIPVTVTNNVVKDFAGSALSATPAINGVGISMQGYGGKGHNFSGNTVSGISNINTSVGQSYAMGIQVQGNTTGGTMSKNKVYDIRNANAGTVAIDAANVDVETEVETIKAEWEGLGVADFSMAEELQQMASEMKQQKYESLLHTTAAAGGGIAGIYFSAGDGWNVSNNMVSVSNGVGTNDALVFGIADYCNGAMNVFYNSVFVGGTSSGTTNTYAYQRGGNSRLNLFNNLFYNERSSGSGVSYAVGNTAAVPTDGWQSASSSYNTFIAPSATMGEWGSGAGQTFAQWKSTSGGDNESYSDATANVPSASLFTNTSTGDLSIISTNSAGWYVNGKGIAGSLSGSIATDYAGDPRSTTQGTPTDIGADEFTSSAVPTDAVMSGTIGDGNTTTFTFGGRPISSITWHTGAGILPTSVSNKYYSGELPPTAPAGTNYIHSYWNINVPDGTPGYTYDMTLYYTPADIRTIPENDLGMAKRNPPALWTHVSGTTTNTTLRTVSGAGFTDFSQFTLDQNSDPLPIQLAFFRGIEVQNRGVRLEWQTISEVNNYGFFVQRKRTNETEWARVNSLIISGHGTSNEPHDYMLLDNKAVRGDWQYRLEQVDLDGTLHHTEPINVSVVTSVQETVPVEFTLKQNYPNPFNPSTQIEFGVPVVGIVTITVYDALGREVRTLVNENLRAGSHEVTFDATGLTSGVYFYRMRAGEFTQTRRLLLVR